MINEIDDINNLIDDINNLVDKYIALNRCINNTLEYVNTVIKELDNYYYSIEGNYDYAELEKDYIERFMKILNIIKDGLKKNVEDNNINN